MIRKNNKTYMNEDRGVVDVFKINNEDYASVLPEWRSYSKCALIRFCKSGDIMDTILAQCWTKSEVEIIRAAQIFCTRFVALEGWKWKLITACIIKKHTQLATAYKCALIHTSSIFQILTFEPRTSVQPTAWKTISSCHATRSKLRQFMLSKNNAFGMTG